MSPMNPTSQPGDRNSFKWNDSGLYYKMDFFFVSGGNTNMPGGGGTTASGGQTVTVTGTE